MQYYDIEEQAEAEMAWRFRNKKVVSLILLGVLIHGLVLMAAFDIYFSSPIDHGMTPVRTTRNPPAKRAVFIVADGLRAEAIFGKGQSVKAPFLTKIRKTRGSWGVAHTRVPTESRPGHVALLAGIYEDPAAILKGWKANPVDFDSVINQSTNAWCWGSPDIVNMFNKDKLPHIHLSTYSAEMEDFGKNNTSILDLWVFEKVEEFINERIKCLNCTDFRQKGNLFFLHLLGIDTAGHGFKPDSKEYKENIKIVDSNVEKIEKLFQNAFRDNATAFIFTADHGMTDWGSHGSGSDHETKTPLIAWGAGIRTDETQRDVKQVDIAPLISGLIGNNFPINSVGRLPYDYFKLSPVALSNMMLANVYQLLETFNVKRFKRMKNAIRFVPFASISDERIEIKIDYLKTLMRRGQHKLLRIESETIMQFLIQGADYYHNYYQLPILISVTIGMVAWIIILATFNIRVRRTAHSKRILRYIQIFIFIPMYLNVVMMLRVQELPPMYYAYFCFPIFLVQILVRRYLFLLEAFKQMKNYGIRACAANAGVFVLGMRILVKGFEEREFYSFIMIIMALYVTCSKTLRIYATRHQKYAWAGFSLILSVFPYLPVMRTSFNVFSYLVGFLLWWLIFSRLVSRQMRYPYYDRPHVTVVEFQLTMMKLTPVYTLCVELGLVDTDSYLKYVAWIWALYPMICIPCSSTDVFVRLTSIFVGFAPFYLMVTTNYEILFLAIYALLLFTWLIVETKSFRHINIYEARFTEQLRLDRVQTIDDFRRAFIFVAMIFVGFFGTGNIASLNSFDPMWVRCFLTVFSPFKMAGLILLKLAVPFIFTSCTYRAINYFRRGDILNMFCLVLLFSDLMLLELLYCITNIGSWLQIGMSLSHFIIMEAFVLILLATYGLAYLLTTVSYNIRFNRYLYYL